MAVRSLRVARAYWDLCRAAAQTFREDITAQRTLRTETVRTLRQQATVMSEEQMVTDLKSGTDFIRYEIVQASYQDQSSNYKAHITQEHISRGDVLDLQPPTDPSTVKAS